MSLHRVASIENWERPTGDARAFSPVRQPRKMSFNPVGEWTIPTLVIPEDGTTMDSTTKPVVSVSEQISSLESSSTAKRLLQVAIAAIYCLLSSGLVFGFAALKPVLVAEGVYRNYCPKSEGPGDGLHTCYEQEIRLNLMFAAAAVATNVCALPVGTILDRYGPRVSSIIGSVLLAVGSAFFIFAPHAPANFDVYIPGYLFLALAGPFVYISSFQLSNCFPRYSGLILALLTGAFDTSSAMFLVYRLIYQATDGSFKPSSFFTIYLVVPVFVLAVQLTIMPADSYKTVGEMVADAVPSDMDPVRANELNEAEQERIEQQQQLRRESILTEFEPLLGKTAEQQQKEEDQRKRVSGVWGALHGKSALQQIRTPWFILITALVVVQMTRINYFVATVRSQYAQLLHDYDLAVGVNRFFDYALPSGGVIAVPVVGILLDQLSTTTTLALLTFFATFIGILGVLPFLWAAYANIVLFVVYRPFYYTAVSDYAAKVFGFHTFGKVYGLIICIAGLGNFSQSALDALTHRAFGDDPVPVNLILMAIVVVFGSALVVYVHRQSIALDRVRLEAEAEESEQRESLLPGATDRPGRANGRLSVPNGYGATS